MYKRKRWKRTYIGINPKCLSMVNVFLFDELSSEVKQKVRFPVYPLDKLAFTF